MRRPWLSSRTATRTSSERSEHRYASLLASSRLCSGSPAGHLDIWYRVLSVHRFVLTLFSFFSLSRVIFPLHRSPCATHAKVEADDRATEATWQATVILRLRPTTPRAEGGSDGGNAGHWADGSASANGVTNVLVLPDASEQLQSAIPRTQPTAAAARLPEPRPLSPFSWRVEQPLASVGGGQRKQQQQRRQQQTSSVSSVLRGILRSTGSTHAAPSGTNQQRHVLARAGGTGGTGGGDCSSSAVATGDSTEYEPPEQQAAVVDPDAVLRQARAARAARRAAAVAERAREKLWEAQAERAFDLLDVTGRGSLSEVRLSDVSHRFA